MKNETVGDLLKKTGMTLDQLINGFCKNYHGVIWTEEATELNGKKNGRKTNSL